MHDTTNRSAEGRGDDWETAWEWHKQLDATLAWRTGYFLIVQVVLIAGFAALFASGRSDIANVKHAEYAICVFGIFLLFAQWTMNDSLIKKLSDLKKDYLEPLPAVHRQFADLSLRPANDLQLVAIPVALWILWVLLFELALSA